MRLKLALQEEHRLLPLHIKQLLILQVKHPFVLLLRVNPVMQVPQVLLEVQVWQLVTLQGTQVLVFETENPVRQVVHTLLLTWHPVGLQLGSAQGN